MNNVMLRSEVGTADRLGSEGVGLEDEGADDNVHVKGLSVGLCKSVSVDVDDFTSKAYTTINKKRRRQMAKTDNDDKHDEPRSTPLVRLGRPRTGKTFLYGST